MSSAERVGVPLKSMCSMRCEMPAHFAGSWREPEPTKSPTATLSASHGTNNVRKPPTVTSFALPTIAACRFGRSKAFRLVTSNGELTPPEAVTRQSGTASQIAAICVRLGPFSMPSVAVSV